MEYEFSRLLSYKTLRSLEKTVVVDIIVIDCLPKQNMFRRSKVTRQPLHSLSFKHGAKPKILRRQQTALYLPKESAFTRASKARAVKIDIS